MTHDTRSDGVLEREDERARRPKTIIVLMVGLVFQGLSGVAGGLALVVDPTGAMIGLPAEWLAGSPFDGYAIPGAVLLTLLGIVPSAVAIGVWMRRSWSWAASLLVAVALLIWLAVEVAVIGYHAQPPLQLIYGVVGALILGVTLMPSVRAHLADHSSGR